MSWPHACVAVDPSDIAWIRERTRVPILQKPFGVDDVTRVIAAAERQAM
jgi:hypothetical protein